MSVYRMDMGSRVLVVGRAVMIVINAFFDVS